MGSYIATIDSNHAYMALDGLRDLFSQRFVNWLLHAQKLFRHITLHWWNQEPHDIAVSSTFLSAAGLQLCSL